MTNPKDSNFESELDHPCKDTCSGWQQGYDKGRTFTLAECKEEIERLKAENKKIGALGRMAVEVVQKELTAAKDEILKSEAKLAQAVEALRFYADGEHYEKCDCEFATLPEECPHNDPLDCGERAREVLEKIEVDK